MSTNEITIRTSGFTFKSKDLTKATLGLADCFNGITKAYKDACIILAKVDKAKSYRDDGFSSLADYGETIGLAKSITHKMENAGRLLISDDATIRDFAAKTDYSKLSILASADESDVKDAIASGELSPDSTQANVREWKAAKAASKEDKEKVVPTWHIIGTAVCTGAKVEDMVCVYHPFVKEIDVTIGIASPVNWAREYDNTAIVASTKDENGKVYYMALTADGSMFNYTAERVKAEKKSKKQSGVMDMSKLTDAQLAALIAEYNKRQTGQGQDG